jgi:hypothetical protein
MLTFRSPSALTVKLLVALATWVPLKGVSAQPLASRIVQVQGDVQVETAAGRRTGEREMRVDGSTVRTGANGQAQIMMVDGTLVALSPASELVLSAAETKVVTLQSGGLRIDATPAPDGWRVQLPGRSILTNGFLRLQTCEAGCTLAPGLYGRIVQGDAVLEYQGGRSVLRNRSFLWTSPSSRPEVLSKVPPLFDDTSNQTAAVRVRTEVAEQLRIALEAFRDGKDDLARVQLEQVRALAPGEPIVDYYLGLVALRQGDEARALEHLKLYAHQDPDGAASRDIGKTLTLLSSSQLQKEVANAVQREQQVASAPPEPNSIAVNAFVNQGDESYRALSKGLAAMIIADLSKVPGLKVLEREKVQLLVNEMKLGDSGLADSASAVRSGRLMRAEKVIVGNFEVK